MEQDTYTIVFQKLAEAAVEQPRGGSLPSEAGWQEIEEIAELRRMVVEITDPEPTSYTVG